MPLPLGKLQNLSVDNEARKEVHVADFIPYACHIDPHTLLTKNGEVLQIIKITGFAYELVGGSKITLRDAIRKALFASLPNDRFALWFHTIRRKKNLDPPGEFPEGFPQYLHNAWVERHDWPHKYMNEVYITVVREGADADWKEPVNFLRGLWPPATLRHYNNAINRAHAELEETVSRMLETLKTFGAQRLSIVERQGVCFSEPLKFLGKIINLQETLMPVPVMDISEYLPTHKIAFGFNVMEVKGETGRHFGTVLTIKEYKEVESNALDEFLQMDQELIITQCIDFINRSKAVKQYKFQRYITELSGDEELAQLSGLKEMAEADHGNPIDYGENQITVFLLEDNLEQLEKSVDNAMKVLASLGIVAMREDVRLEHCFWSQLPGNFEFVSRLKPINTMRAGGFAALYNFPAGKAIGNHWGPAVTVFYTAIGTPYFFNFHLMDNGHTTIIGPFGAGKTVLLNFLLSEAQKFKPRMFFFDYNHGSEIFLRALGGNYIPLMPDPENPLSAVEHLPRLDQRIYGFDVSRIASDHSILDPVLQHLFQKIEMELDGKPTIIVLDEAWSLLDSPAFSGKLENWLSQLRQKNAIVILATESIEQAEHSDLTKRIFSQIGTQIYLPHESADETYRSVFNLTEDEFRLLKLMIPERRQFLLKHGNDAVVAELNLEGMDDITAVLSARTETLELLRQLLTGQENEPGKWLPAFMEKACA